MEEFKLTHESIVLRENLLKILINFGFSKSSINKKLKWGQSKFSRILGGDQDPTLGDLNKLSNLFGISICNLISVELETFSIENLSTTVVEEAKINIGKTSKQYDSTNAVSYLIIVLTKVWDKNKKFTKKELTAFLPFALQTYSVEWKKTKLRNHISDTNTTRKAITKPSKLYKLNTEIEQELIEEALTHVDPEWLDLVYSINYSSNTTNLSTDTEI